MSSPRSAKALRKIGRAGRVGLRLSSEGRKIVSTLNQVLRASVVIYDGNRDQTHHLESGPDRRLAVRNGVIDGRRHCSLHARINDRWTLVVSAWRPLHPDAQALLKWAADKLAARLPRRAADESADAPVGAGGGGSSGGAELGIPVWWLRNARSN